MSGCPGAVRSGSTFARPALSAGRSAQAAADDARTPRRPEDHLGGERPVAIDDALRAAFANRKPQLDFNT